MKQITKIFLEGESPTLNIDFTKSMNLSGATSKTYFPGNAIEN